MTTLALATIGGLVSLASTSVGAVLSQFTSKVSGSFRWNLSIDFALGLMVSASAFTLIFPAAHEAAASGHSLTAILTAALAGMVFVHFLKKQVQVFQAATNFKSSHLILASVLMLHNFPEGLASGASLAGLGWTASLPILSGISLQNIPEGALMVMCLKAMGWSARKSLLGGLGSGLVELLGGVLAGLLLGSVQGLLPGLLSFAGGAMIASVVVELMEGEKKIMERLWSAQFAGGLLCLPLLQLVTN